MLKMKRKKIINNIISISSLSFLFIVPIAMIASNNSAINPIFNNTSNENKLRSSQQILNTQKFITNKSQVSSDGQYVLQESDNNIGTPVLQIINNDGYTGQSEQNLKHVDANKAFPRTVSYGVYDKTNNDRHVLPDSSGHIGTANTSGLFFSGKSTNPLDIYSWNSTNSFYKSKNTLTAVPTLPCYRMLPIGKTLKKTTGSDDSHINVVSDAAYQKSWSSNSVVNDVWFTFNKDFSEVPVWEAQKLFNTSPYPFFPLDLANLVTTPDGVIYFTSRLDSRDLGVARDGASKQFPGLTYNSDEYYFYIPYNSDSATTDIVTSTQGTKMWFDQAAMGNHSLTTQKLWPDNNPNNKDRLKWTVIDSVYNSVTKQIDLLLLNKDDNQSYVASANLTINNNISKMTIDKISKDFCFTPTNSQDKSGAGIASTIYELNDGQLLVSNSNGSYRLYDKDLNPLNSPNQKVLFTNNYYAQNAYNSISQVLPMPGAGEYALSMNAESPYLYYIPADGKGQAKKVIDLNKDASIDLENAYYNFSNLSTKDIKKTKLITSINFIQNKKAKYKNSFLQINTGYTDPNGNVLSWIAKINPNDPTNLQIIGTGYDYLINKPQISTSESLYLKSKQIISNFNYKPTSRMVDSLNKQKENGDVEAKTFRQDYIFPKNKNIKDYLDDYNGIITTNDLDTSHPETDGWFNINLWTGDQVLAQLKDVSFGNPVDGVGNNTTLPIDLTINIDSPYGGGIPSITTKVVRINSFDSFAPVIVNNQTIMLPYIIGTSVAAAVLILIIITSYLIWRHKKIKENISYIKAKRKTRFETRTGEDKSRHQIRKEARKAFKSTLNSEDEKLVKTEKSTRSFFNDKKIEGTSKNNKKSNSILKDLSYDSLQNKSVKSKLGSKPNKSKTLSKGKSSKKNKKI